jgi:hypothetical protein
MRRALYPLFLAAICVAVLASHVFIEFERVRYQVAVAPQAGDQTTVVVPLPDLRRLAEAPAAIVLRFSGADQPTRVTIAIDGAPVAEIAVPARRTIRVDASAQPAPGPGPSTGLRAGPSTGLRAGRQLTVTGDRAGWKLLSMEIANVYGFSDSVPKFVIVPRERPPVPAVPMWAIVLIAIALVALQPDPNWPRGRVGRAVYRTGAGLVLLLFVSMLVSAVFTKYKVLLSRETFFICLAILYSAPVVHGVHRLGAVPYRRWAPFLPHAAVVAMVLWSVGQFYSPDTGFTSLIRFGEEFEQSAVPALRRLPHAVEPGSGYDGQFYAQLALDPLLRNRPTFMALDSVAYRGRRIFLPWTSYVLGFGVPRLVVQVYALLNVVCWLILGVLLLRWLPAGELRPTLVWITCALNPGLLTSIRNSLPDGPSMLILTLGVLAIERNRRGLAAGVLGLAGLTRETNLLGGLMLARESSPKRSMKRSLMTLVFQAFIAALPLLLWIAYLQYLGAPPGGAGSRNFGTPLGGYVEKWAVTARELGVSGWESLARISLLSLIALTTQAVALVWLRDWRSPWWRMGIAYAGLMMFLGQAVWEGHPGAATRVLMPMTFAFNVLLHPTRWFWPLWILGNANVLDGLVQ